MDLLHSDVCSLLGDMLTRRSVVDLLYNVFCDESATERSEWSLGLKATCLQVSVCELSCRWCWCLAAAADRSSQVSGDDWDGCLCECLLGSVGLQTTQTQRWRGGSHQPWRRRRRPLTGLVSGSYIHSESKNMPPDFCPHLRQTLTDFHNSFTDTFCLKTKVTLRPLP